MIKLFRLIHPIACRLTYSCELQTMPLPLPFASPIASPRKDSDLFAVTSSGATPFFAACEGGRVEVVRSLMEKATAMGKLEEMCNKKDTSDKTPFDMAAAGQHKVSLRATFHLYGMKCIVVVIVIPLQRQLLLMLSCKQPRKKRQRELY